jgi:DNA-binding PadR family transcriptional regulator
MTADTEPGGLVHGTLQILILKTLTLEHVSENNRRAKYYHLPPQGRARLSRETRQWEAQATAIAGILAATPGQL